MDNKYICPVCKKQFKNENGLRGHLQWMKDEEHQKLFREWGQTSEMPMEIKSGEVPPIVEKPPDEKKTLEVPASEIPQPLSEQKRKFPPVIPPSEERLQARGEVPLYEEKPAVPTGALTAADILQIIREENQRVVQQQTEPIAKVERPTAPLDIEELEPYEWFKWFLNGKPRSYGLYDKTIEVLADRVQLRQGELPQPAQLQKDIPRIQKNITEEVAAVVAEAYFFHLQKYQESRRKRAEYWQQPYQGIRIPEVKPHVPYGDIRTQQSIPRQQPYQEQQQYPPQYYYQQPPLYEQQRNPFNPYQQPSPTLEQEIAKFEMMRQLFAKTGETNPAIDRVERDNQDLKNKIEQMAIAKEREILDNLSDYRAQLQQETQRRREAEEQVRQSELRAQQHGLTETDVSLEQIRKTHDLEMAKLGEKGKTREVIANALTGGFSSVGDAIFKTAQELGTKEEVHMEGVTDGGHMWQTNCPKCNTQITAPESASIITCPSCDTKFEVLPEKLPEERQQQQPNIGYPERQQQQTPRSTPSAGFSVETKVPDHMPREASPPPERRAPIRDTPSSTTIHPPVGEPIHIEQPPQKPTPEQALQKDTGRISATAKPLEVTPQEIEELPSEKLRLDMEAGNSIPLDDNEQPEQENQSESIPPEFVCPKCGKPFGSEMQLKGHMLHHAKEEKKMKKE